LPKVHELLQTSGVDLSKGGRIPERQAFQRHLSQYRIVVYSGLRCDNIMFDGQVATSQRMNLLYDGEHYHVITKLTAAMAKRYMCPSATRVVAVALSIDATRRAMPAQSFLRASRTMLGSHVMGVIDTLETRCVLRITNVSKYRTRLSARQRDVASSVVL